MASLVIYGNEFERQLDNGLDPTLLRYRFLVEGDSWMDRSAMFDASLLKALADEMDARGTDALFINLSLFGETMRRMGELAGRDFAQWLGTAFVWRFDAVLLSAGGNDFIDAAREPPPGLGILRDLRGAAQPADGADALDRAAVARLANEWLDPSFARLHGVLRASRHAGIPLFLNHYDLPTARPAPAFPGGRVWLCEAYAKNGIAPDRWPALTAAVFDAIDAVLDGWAVGRDDVVPVPTRGTLTPAEPGTTGRSGDWLNEIHPAAPGWRKLARVWARTMAERLGA